MDLLLDAFIDALKSIPFLFLVYLLLEFLENRMDDSVEKLIVGTGRFGPFLGALVGCIPQCGFSVAAASLYSRRIITIGTLLAVFLSTSDEAIPILLSNPKSIRLVLPLLACKILIALAGGFFLDLLWQHQATQQNRPKSCRPGCPGDHAHQHACQSQDTADCQVSLSNQYDCCHDNVHHAHKVWLHAIKKTLRVFFFLLLVNIFLNLAVELIGQQRLSQLLLTNSFWQPLLAALLGLIPNCAASILITEMYLGGSLSFGATVAGLSTGAGLGLAILFKENRPFSQNLLFLAALYLTGSLAGLLLQSFI